jgi:hypothetical protein
MPSSMIFASLVVLWLLILVPAVARHRQEVARPSVAALSGRVLARSPRRRSQEVDGMGERDGEDTGQVVATRVREVQVPSARAELRPEELGDGPGAEVEDLEHDMDHDADADAEDLDDPEWDADDESAEHDDRVWERPPPRYRAGRGGFDAEAAALTARARYTFRQRVVLLMLIAAVATGIVAAVAVRSVWWAHGAIDVALVGYLVYLRRQVRLEENIRARRAARMAGTRRPSAADDPELDDWAERGRDVTRHAGSDEDDNDQQWLDEHADDVEEAPAETASARASAVPTLAAASPVPPPPAVEEERPALPRLNATPTPPLPPGTTLVDDEDDELHLDDGATPGYRRAVGQ